MTDIPIVRTEDIPLPCFDRTCPVRVTHDTSGEVHAPGGANFFSFRRAQWWIKMFSSDIKFFVIRTIAVFGAICLFGGIICYLTKAIVPEFLVAGFSLCLGYLGGVLAPPRNGNKE